MSHGDRRSHATGSRVVAIATAFHPGPSLRAVVNAALPQVGSVVVVDNTPAGHPGAAEVLGSRAGVTVLADGVNSGLAAALSRGIDASGTTEFLFLLDQDSVVAPNLVASLVALLDDDPWRAIASPAPWDPIEQRFLDPRTPSRPEIAEMTVVITSAMLLRRAAYEQTGGLRTDFFVDAVDQDLCLKLRAGGWSIVQDRRLLLPHSLGETRWYGLGRWRIRATHHPTWRLYWAARNSTVLGREYWRTETRWSLTNALVLIYWMATVLVFEPPRVRRVLTMLRGVVDGLSGRRDERYLPGAGG